MRLLAKEYPQRADVLIRVAQNFEDAATAFFAAALVGNDDDYLDAFLAAHREAVIAFYDATTRYEYRKRLGCDLP